MKKSNLKWLLQVALLSVLIVAISAATVSATENLTVHFLDVGQGDSELLQFDGKNVLIDAGTSDMGPRVESYLRDHGVSSLDLLVATHPHEDHIGGLITILKDIPVKQVLDSGQTHTAPSFETYLNLIDQKGIPFETAQRGQTINLDPNLKIEVLSPPATLFSDDLNQNSVVLKVTYNKVSFLLMGDAGIEAENSLLSSSYNLDSDILKVGHHGSSSASSSSFLAKVKPAISIIEVGKGNDYGHPTKKTLSALQNTGSKIYRTDLDGDIVVTTDGQSYTVTTGKQPFWNTASTAPKSTSSATTWTSGGTASSTTATTTAALSSDGPFVGSAKSNKYHYPSCSGAQKIKPANQVTFSSSADARAQGYVPCGICHPP
ncbi:MAG: MBL fold metallo-hydrolase [Methanothrix sp.]|nr:MAG: MBL fold metallo-hydrolase [Methanothrix sp.]